MLLQLQWQDVLLLGFPVLLLWLLQVDVWLLWLLHLGLVLQLLGWPLQCALLLCEGRLLRHHLHSGSQLVKLSQHAATSRQCDLLPHNAPC